MRLPYSRTLCAAFVDAMGQQSPLCGELGRHMVGASVKQAWQVPPKWICC